MEDNLLNIIRQHLRALWDKSKFVPYFFSFQCRLRDIIPSIWALKTKIKCDFITEFLNLDKNRHNKYACFVIPYFRLDSNYQLYEGTCNLIGASSKICILSRQQQKEFKLKCTPYLSSNNYRKLKRVNIIDWCKTRCNLCESLCS